MNGKQIATSHKRGLILFHLAGVYALVFISPKPGDWAIAICALTIRIFGITAGYHRLFTHRGYQAIPGLDTVLALIGNSAGQGPLKRWVANHWLHHRHVETKLDPHSPNARGFWYAHLGWLLDAAQFERAEKESKSFQFSNSIEWINQHSNALFFAQIPVLVCVHLLGHAFAPEYFLPRALGVNYSFSVMLLLGLHSTFAINSVCHVWGYKRPDGRDESRNNPFIAFLTLGEGWHANHHRFPQSMRHGLRWYEFDFTYCVLSLFENLGWISHAKRNPMDPLPLPNSNSQSQQKMAISPRKIYLLGQECASDQALSLKKQNTNIAKANGALS